MLSIINNIVDMNAFYYLITLKIHVFFQTKSTVITKFRSNIHNHNDNTHFAYFWIDNFLRKRQYH